jgi:hypothetical protein
MTTRMQMAFIMSPSVTMQTPLGKRILEIAASQIHREELHIRRVAAERAEARAKVEDEINGILSEAEQIIQQQAV